MSTENCPTSGRPCVAYRMSVNICSERGGFTLGDQTIWEDTRGQGLLNNRVSTHLINEEHRSLIESATSECDEFNCGVVALGAVMAARQLAKEQAASKSGRRV
jgi:hypothetical protein